VLGKVPGSAVLAAPQGFLFVDYEALNNEENGHSPNIHRPRKSFIINTLRTEPRAFPG
jgi:hypothetical protein